MPLQGNAYGGSVYESPYTKRSYRDNEPLNLDNESIACPYGCGTVLTGVHAQGNLTRHLKSQSCRSGRPKVKYVCLVPGCGREYTRSDGLRVHMSKRHGEYPPLRRAEDEAYAGYD